MKYVKFEIEGILFEIAINGNMYITLKNARRKKIGRWDFYTRTIKKNKWNTHIFQKTNSIAVPYHFLKYFLTEHPKIFLEVEMDNGTYFREIVEDDLKDIKYFKKKGYELQAFFPLNSFKLYKA